jgi:hypothetical protein
VIVKFAVWIGLAVRHLKRTSHARWIWKFDWKEQQWKRTRE